MSKQHSAIVKVALVVGIVQSIPRDDDKERDRVGDIAQKAGNGGLQAVGREDARQVVDDHQQDGQALDNG